MPSSAIAARMTIVFSRRPRTLYRHNIVLPFAVSSSRYASVFSGLLSDNNPQRTTTDGFQPAWHCPEFMSSSSIAEKEAWLERLLTATKNPSRKTVTNRRETEWSSHSTSADAEAFLVVLRALASVDAVNDAGAPRRADVWMNRLLEASREQTEKNRLQPTPECYQHVIQAWANSNKEQAIVIRNRMERWLNEVTEHNESASKLEPTIDCFNAYLDGLSRGRRGKTKRDRELLRENAVIAEGILRRLHSGYIHHHSSKPPTNETTEKQKRLLANNDSRATRAIAIRPTTDTFNFAIRGWTRCKHEPNIDEKVLALLRLMESYQRDNPVSFVIDRDAPRPNTKSYSMAMDALVSKAKQKARRHYNYHQRQRRNPLEREPPSTEQPSMNGVDEMTEAESILNYMHDLHDAGVQGVTPNRVSYNILITGWAALASFSNHRGDERVFKAEEILRTMISFQKNGCKDASPDALSFEKVMLAWANSGHPNAGKRALWWLKQLWKNCELHPTTYESSSHQSTLFPTVNTYNVVMKALASTDGALAAENVLLDLGEKYRDTTDGLCPNSESFAIVIRAWLQEARDSRNIDDRISSIRRAYEWLCSLRGIENENKLSTAPELFTGLLAVSKTCARQRPAVLDLGLQVFEDFRKSRHRLDYISYATLLQVGLRSHSTTNGNSNSNRSSGKAREEFVEKLFAECCDDGLISNVFVRTLVDDPSIECQQLVDRALREFPLPSSWSRNLKNKNSRCTPMDLMSAAERHSMRRRREQRNI